MKLKTTKGTKSFAFIRKHKTAFGIIAGIFIIILVVSFCVQDDEPAITNGSPVRYSVANTNKETAKSKPETGSESKPSVTETDKNSVKSNIETDTWYVYKQLDLLKFQNCVIYNATTLGSKGIMVQYFSVCKKCYAIHNNGEGLPRSTAAEPNIQTQKMYHCGKCGETTVVRLEVRQ